LRLSKAEAARMQAWATAPVVKDDMPKAGLDRLFYRLGTDGIAMRLKLALAVARGKAEDDFDEMSRSARLLKLIGGLESWKKPPFPIGGADALNMGLPAGPRVGEVLAAIEQQWLDGNFVMDRAALLARLKEMAG
jgi:poly(A) polymerase